MTQTGAPEPGRLRLLLDSNVVIAVEPFSGELEQDLEVGARLLRLANEQSHLLCVAPATRDDLLQGKDPIRREQRLAELAKFHLLAEAPVTSALRDRAGPSAPGTNDARDLRLLAELEAGAVTHLVTNDLRLLRRASRAGLGDAVLTLQDAAELLAGFAPEELQPPPRVTKVPAYTLNVEDPIFDGLRGDYPEFDDWLKKVRRESDTRKCYIIEERGAYAGLALLKPEADCAYAFDGPVVKVSTFKVSGAHSGVKYGELLLKAILMEAAATDCMSLYVEVLPSHPEVMDFLEAFGFEDSGHRTTRGEHVLLKSRKPHGTEAVLSDLDYHIRHGPPALLCRQEIFIVPIEPRWHDQLFPEQAPRARAAQLSLFGPVAPETHPWGNALRKAYLCNSPTDRVCEGDVLLFYRSQDQRLSAVGIVEDSVRSSDANEVVQFVGRRTVYSASEIAAMARRARGVLAIRFRQDRFLEPPLTLTDMRLAGALRSWPQSITRLKGTAAAWMREQIVGSP